MSPRLVAWLLPAACATAMGLVTIDGGYVFDDERAIADNPVVNGSAPAGQAFVRDFWGQTPEEGVTTWRPLLPLLWRAVWAAGDRSPLPFRALSLLLHVGATLALVWAGRRLGAPPLGAAAAGVLFALHPVRAQALGTLVGQADLLSALLGLLAVGATAERTRRATLLVAALLGLAFLVKESAITQYGECRVGAAR